MSLIAGMYFNRVEGHFRVKQSTHKFTQHPNILFGNRFVYLGGYALCNNAYRQLFFNVLTPLKLPVHLLAWLVVILSALPTAYSGASGILDLQQSSTF